MESKLNTLIGKNKTMVNRREYKLCLTAFVGHTPSEFELEILFHDACSIPISHMKKVITRYTSPAIDRECEAIQIFRLFDSDGKGCINLKDIYRTWKKISPSLSWKHISECFNDISIDNNLHFDLFKTMYIAEAE